MLDPETLALIKREADRLQQTAGLDIDEAYQAAIVTIIKLEAEQLAVDPFEARILAEMDRLARNQQGRPVSVLQLAVVLGNMNRFTLHHHLSQLESRNLVCRPRGPKSGWLRVTPARPAADGRVRA